MTQDLRTLVKAMRDAQRAYWNATAPVEPFKVMKEAAEAALNPAKEG